MSCCWANLLTTQVHPTKLSQTESLCLGLTFAHPLSAQLEAKFCFSAAYYLLLGNLCGHRLHRDLITDALLSTPEAPGILVTPVPDVPRGSQLPKRRPTSKLAARRCRPSTVLGLYKSYHVFHERRNSPSAGIQRSGACTKEIRKLTSGDNLVLRPGGALSSAAFQQTGQHAMAYTTMLPTESPYFKYLPSGTKETLPEL